MVTFASPLAARVAPRTLFDELFRDVAPGYFIKPAREGAADEAAVPVFAVATEVREDAGSYTILADLPGVAKEDIHVSIDGKAVTLSAEVRRSVRTAAPVTAPVADAATDGAEAPAAATAPAAPVAASTERVLRSERRYGRAQRSFTLPTEVDASNSRAKFENGVLTLTLPKLVVAAARRVTVE